MRLIDADAFVKQIMNEISADTNKDSQTEFAKKIALTVCKAIEDQPTVEPRAGKWQKVSADKYIHFSDYIYRCDQCGKTSVGQWSFCPNCGASM